MILHISAKRTIGSMRKRADVDNIRTARGGEGGKERERKGKRRNGQTPVTVRARGWLHILISKRAERNARHTSVCRSNDYTSPFHPLQTSRSSLYRVVVVVVVFYALDQGLMETFQVWKSSAATSVRKIPVSSPLGSI